MTIPSIRQQLVRRLVPLALGVLLVSGTTSFLLAWVFANRAYDHWLLDAARSLATQVNVADRHVRFQLTRETREVFEWDATDRTYFRVQSLESGYLGGFETLPLTPGAFDLVADEPRFFETVVSGANVRGVAIRVRPDGSTDSVVVEVAETLNKRSRLATDILLTTLLPLLVLAVLGVWLVQSAIVSGFVPLGGVARDLAEKDERDLTPLATERVPLEVLPLVTKLNELLQRLARAFEAQRQFIADAAHQLRTPIAGIKLQSELMLREIDPAVLRATALTLRATADRAAHLSTQLLTLARTEPDYDVTSEFERCDLVALARDTGSAWVPEAIHNQVELEFAAPDHPVMIRAAPFMMRELIANLIDNAIRYGGHPGRVTLRVEDEGEHALLQVEDDGPGIAPALRERIFDRFVRADPNNTEGCGLGLAIVREIVLRHGGTVTLEPATASPSGCLFSVRLPKQS